MDIRGVVSSPSFPFLFLFVAALTYFLVLWKPTASPSEGFLVLASATPDSAYELPAAPRRSATTGAVKTAPFVQAPAPIPQSSQSSPAAFQELIREQRHSPEPLQQASEEDVVARHVGFAIGESKNIYVGDLEELEVDGDAFSVELVGNGVVSVEALRKGTASLRGSGFELELDSRGSNADSEDGSEADYEVPPDGVGLVELEVGDAYPVALVGIRNISIGNPGVIDVMLVRGGGSSSEDVLIHALSPGQSSLDLGEVQLWFRVHPTS